MNKKNHTKLALAILLPIIAIALVYVIFFMPINVNTCDSPYTTKDKLMMVPAVCAKSYTTIWRQLTGKERIIKY